MSEIDLSQVRRIGLDKRRTQGGVGRYAAVNDAHLRATIERLDATGDHAAADTIAWLVWWNELNNVRKLEAFEKLTQEQERFAKLARLEIVERTDANFDLAEAVADAIRSA